MKILVQIETSRDYFEGRDVTAKKVSKKYENEVETIEGEVVEVDDDGEIIPLDSDQKYQTRNFLVELG